MNSCNTDIFFSNYYHLQSVRFELHSLLGWAYLDSRCPDFVGVMQVLFYCITLAVIKSVLIKPVLTKSFEMKRPFMVWIGFYINWLLKRFQGRQKLP